MMDVNKTMQDQVSAFADGELDNGQVDAALAVLRQPAALAAWDTYHQIGDVLRSDDMAVKLSPGFAARMAERLALEPAIVAPGRTVLSQTTKTSETPGQRRVKRLAIPGMAAAAMAAVAFFTGPQLLVAINGNPGVKDASVMPVASVTSVSNPAASTVLSSGGVVAASVVESVPTSEGVILRDPRIDEYLLAHQRSSPSMLSTAQYARSATFANDSNK